MAKKGRSRRGTQSVPTRTAGVQPRPPEGLRVKSPFVSTFRKKGWITLAQHVCSNYPECQVLIHAHVHGPPGKSPEEEAPGLRHGRMKVGAEEFAIVTGLYHCNSCAVKAAEERRVIQEASDRLARRRDEELEAEVRRIRQERAAGAAEGSGT
jgi:hypothetical protein